MIKDGLPICTVGRDSGRVWVHDLATERLLREMTELVRDLRSSVGVCCMPAPMMERVTRALERADAFLGRPV